MKIIFKENTKKDVLIVNISPKNGSTNSPQAIDEIVKEDGVKTLYLKCDEKMNLRKFFLLVRKMIQIAKSAKAEKIAFNFNDFMFKFSDEAKSSKTGSPDASEGAFRAEIIGSQLDLANYEFTKYKSKKENTFIKEVYISFPKDGLLGKIKEIQKAILTGHTIAQEINKTRTLANTPGGDMTPQILAQKAKEAVKGMPVKVKVLGEKEMQKIKMQAILAVGRGSDEESKFIIMEYQKGKKGEKPIILVGKGVTFDSGGINLKSTSALLGMNMDMSGGAAVIHAVALAAKMKLKKNIIGLIPAVENFISGKSYRPGDVIHSMSGQTIEILNTDAEGRVILADALTYAKKYNPKIVIDVATLSGAAPIALGERMSAIFTDNDELCQQLEKIGDKTGDYIWRLPMWEEYENEIKGNLGDWTNVHNKDSHYGGAIYGAIFLKQFIKGYKWAHLDIAPRMTSMTGEHLAPGALGTSVYLLYKFIEEN